MKPATAIGIVVATLGILMAGIMGGTSPAAFMDIPALLIIIGGTGGVTLASCGMESMKKVPALYKIVFGPPEIDLNARVQQLVGFAEQARREGLLALDGQTAEIEDEFTRKGLQLVVDGSDPELVREVLEAEIDGMIARHHEGAAPVREGRRLCADDGHHRHRHGPGARAPEPVGAGHPGPRHLLILHRDPDGRRLRQRPLPPDRQPPQGSLQAGGRAAHPDPRGHPGRPGRRQPARRGREARFLCAPGGAQVRGRGRLGVGDAAGRGGLGL